MRILVPTLATLLALCACEATPENPAATVTDAVVKLPPVPGRPGAAYFTIRANRETRLTGISSPAAQRIELHESVTRGNMMTMRPIADVPVTLGSSVVFAPGGKHAMLFDISPTVQPGGTMRLTLTFDGLPPVSVDARVEGFGAEHADH